MPVFEPLASGRRSLGFTNTAVAEPPQPPYERPPQVELTPLRTATVVTEAAASPIRRPAWFMALAGLVVGILLATAGWFEWNALRAEHVPSAAHAIWSQIFQTNRNTLIVPADSGLGILENLSKQSVTVEQYANGSYPSTLDLPPGVDKGNIADLGRQRYTSFVDLDIATGLERLPEFTPSRTQFRFSRGVTAEDIKDSNGRIAGVLLVLHGGGDTHELKRVRLHARVAIVWYGVNSCGPP